MHKSCKERKNNNQGSVLVQGEERKEKGESLQGGQKKGLGKEYRAKRGKEVNV